MNRHPSDTKPKIFARTAAAAGTWIIVVGLVLWTLSRLALSGSSSAIAPILIALMIAVVLFALLCIVRVGEVRRNRIRRESPRSFVDLVAISRDTISQLNEMTVAGGVENRVSSSPISVLRIDRGHMEIVGGRTFGIGGKPQVLLSMPLSQDAEFSVSRAADGVFMVKVWHLQQTIDGRRYALDMRPSHALFGLIPWSYSRTQMNSAVDRMQSQQRSIDNPDSLISDGG
ncbi:hypothetical protein [Microbacterium candidum]|uniref:Uncharacterized protein n=1 Tax=Microbacterium candidum TaxID=3041922 RepID=A0ABT7MX46_9MICO|nr:hypothetical protein [Microbacterium sp. ASV49]MDL9979024.1 hypothetical protein [Microbacterium sp. ASV49]